MKVLLRAFLIFLISSCALGAEEYSDRCEAILADPERRQSLLDHIPKASAEQLEAMLKSVVKTL